jgi:hypothetical protein
LLHFVISHVFNVRCSKPHALGMRRNRRIEKIIYGKVYNLYYSPSIKARVSDVLDIESLVSMIDGRNIQC